MNYIKIIKNILTLFCVWYFWPSYNGSILKYILKFLGYLLLIYLFNALINDIVNWLEKNRKKVYLLWIDEREHIKGNTLSKITRMDFIGAVFRLIHYVKFNRRRIMQNMWYGFLENKAIYLTFIIGGIGIILFIVIGSIYYV